MDVFLKRGLCQRAVPCAARLSLRTLPPGEPQASRQRALLGRKDRRLASFFDGLREYTLVYSLKICLFTKY